MDEQSAVSQVTVAQLAAQLARLEARLQDVERASQLGHSSVEDRSVVFFDAEGQPVLLLGQQDDGTYGVAGVNGGIVTATDLDLPAGTIMETDISDDAISTPKLTANAVTADKIEAGAVTTYHLEAGAVTADKIDANAITASKIEAGAIDGQTIKSPDYVPGVSGWIVDADGSAEFADMRARGELVAENPDGSRIEITAADPDYGACILATPATYPGRTLQYRGVIGTSNITSGPMAGAAFLLIQPPQIYAAPYVSMRSVPQGRGVATSQFAISSEAVEIRLGEGEIPAESPGLMRVRIWRNGGPRIYEVSSAGIQAKDETIEGEVPGPLPLNPAGGEVRTGGRLVLRPPVGANSEAISLNHSYAVYADNAGSGGNSTRVWLDGPDGGELVLGPRSGSAWFGTIRLRTNATTSSAANTHMDTAGKIFRSSSSAKYKQDIEDAEGVLDLGAFRFLRPVRFRDRGEVERLGDAAGYHYGFLAEEVHDAGLTEFVHYDVETGEPDGVQYDRLVVGLLQMVRGLEGRVGELEARPA